ncbi:MAG: UDP-N-acetylmuramate--L-alanine ligase [Trueperaceae bacterium]
MARAGKQKKHLHFMGIGGVSMSGLARWYKQDGDRVSGCDLSPSSIVEGLIKEDIAVFVGHSPSHLETSIDTLISTMALSDTHPEIVAAKEQGIRHIKRIELLAELFQECKSIGVTGTHGKSTTTGMVATVYMAANRDPSIQIGANLPLIDGNMRYGQSDVLVAEVDESDPGFVNLQSHIAVITNLEDDHIAGDYDERRNYHASLEDLEEAAYSYAKKANHILYCADWERLTALVGGLETAVSYGYNNNATYIIKNAGLNDGSSRFTLETPSGNVTVNLNVPGNHNVLNAAAALAVAHLDGIDLNVAAHALSTYTGVGRRWQRWGEVHDALVIDDYAHHPTEITVTLTTAKNTGRRVRAVLQPHRYVRTARHWPAIADAAGLADEVLVLEIYGAGESVIPGISSQLIVERLKAAGKNVSFHDLVSAQDYLAQTLTPNDLVITLGAGDVWRIAAGLVKGQHA